MEFFSTDGTADEGLDDSIVYAYIGERSEVDPSFWRLVQPKLLVYSLRPLEAVAGRRVQGSGHPHSGEGDSEIGGRRLR